MIDWRRGLVEAGGKLGEDGSSENCPEIAIEPQLAHPLQHVNRLERVATQGEEIVVAADLSDIEHVQPDFRQRCLDRTDGGFIAHGNGMAISEKRVELLHEVQQTTPL